VNLLSNFSTVNLDVPIRKF